MHTATWSCMTGEFANSTANSFHLNDHHVCTTCSVIKKTLHLSHNLFLCFIWFSQLTAVVYFLWGSGTAQITGTFRSRIAQSVSDSPPSSVGTGASCPVGRRDSLYVGKVLAVWS
jgi:hypothetical protein